MDPISLRGKLSLPWPWAGAVVFLALALSLAGSWARPDDLMGAALIPPLACWLAAIDLRRQILPDILNAALLVAGLTASALAVPDIASRILGVLVGFFVFEAVSRFYFWRRGREGLGQGDSKLLAACGAWLGWQGLPVMVLAASACALIAALVLMALRRLKAEEGRIAFGPFLCAALWLSWATQELWTI